MRRRKASGENRDSGAEGDGECSEYAALVGVELGLDDGSSVHRHRTSLHWEFRMEGCMGLPSITHVSDVTADVVCHCFLSSIV